MASVDAAVDRIVVSVSNQLAPRLSRLVPPPPPDVDPVLLAYLESPDFAEVAHQVVLWRAMRGSLDAGLSASLREQIVQGLLLSGASADPRAVLSALTSVEPLGSGDLDTPTAVGVAHLASAVKNNTLVLRRAPSLADFHAYAGQLRARIAAMRLPHIGGQPLRAVRRAVRAADPLARPRRLLAHRAGPPRRAARRSVRRKVRAGGKTHVGHRFGRVGPSRVPVGAARLHRLLPFRRMGVAEVLRAHLQRPIQPRSPRDAVEYLLRNGFNTPFDLEPHLDELSDRRELELPGRPWTPPDDMSVAVADLLHAWTTRDFNVFE